jgi:hypothetical protein
MLTTITPATSGDLTTLATAKRELGVTFSTDDARIEDLVTAASAMCAQHCNRPEGFGRATVKQVERLVRSRDALILSRDLSPAIISIVEDGVTLTVPNWEIDGTLLYRLEDDERVCWSRGAKVEITYEAGLTLPGSVPADLERAALTVVQTLYSSAGRDPAIKAESVDGVGSVTYDMRSGAEAVPAGCCALLAPWRRVVL